MGSSKRARSAHTTQTSFSSRMAFRPTRATAAWKKKYEQPVVEAPADGKPDGKDGKDAKDEKAAKGDAGKRSPDQPRIVLGSRCKVGPGFGFEPARHPARRRSDSARKVQELGPAPCGAARGAA